MSESGIWRVVGVAPYPDAAWRPSPREPPVMTVQMSAIVPSRRCCSCYLPATLPASEKMFLKSLSLTSASADMVAVVGGTSLRDVQYMARYEG